LGADSHKLAGDTMRVPLLIACMLSLGLAGAQTGDRFKPLVYDEMTPAQKTSTYPVALAELKPLMNPLP
jgi:hypothetical protein